MQLTTHERCNLLLLVREKTLSPFPSVSKRVVFTVQA
jgi:hypothetical protein